MSLLLETIRIHEGQPDNLSCHEDRITYTQFSLDGHRALPALTEILETFPPPASGLYKARLIYNRDLFKVEYQAYEINKISHIRLYQTQRLYYPFKFANRQVFERITRDVPPETAVLIAVGKRITDTTYANIALLKEGEWYTPEHPLLKGTRRCKLLKEGIIHPAEIRTEDLGQYEQIRLFNAMIPWHKAPALPIESIRI